MSRISLLRLKTTMILGLSLFSTYTTNTLLSSMLPLVSTDFSLTPFMGGIITSIYGWAYAAMQIPVGVLSDRYEPRRILCFAMTIFFASTLLFAGATNEFLLVISRLLTGAAGSFIFVVAMRTIAVTYSPNERGKSMGLFISIGLLGISVINFAAPLAVQYLLVGWRAMYLSISLISLLAAILSYLGLPRDTGTDPGEVDKPNSHIDMKSSFAILIRNRHFWIQIIISFLYFGTYFGLVFWMPSYFQQRGLSLTDGGVAVSLLGMGAVLGYLLVGWLVDRMSRLAVLRTSLVIYTLLIAYLVAVPVTQSSLIEILAASFLLGVAEGGLGSSIRIISELFDSSLVGRAYGIYNTMTWMGLAFFPLLIGTLLSAGFGFQEAFFPLIVTMILALVLSAVS